MFFICCFWFLSVVFFVLFAIVVCLLLLLLLFFDESGEADELDEPGKSNKYGESSKKKENCLLAKKEKENTRDGSVPDGSDKNARRSSIFVCKWYVPIVELGK